MAEVASCGTRSIKSIRSYLHLFGTTEASSNGVGRPWHITLLMLEALREYLTERLGQYLDWMAVFLLDEFGVLIATIAQAGLWLVKESSPSSSEGAESRSVRTISS
jgi:hypothetical protein